MPSAGEVHIWKVELDRRWHCGDTLLAEEQKRAARLVHPLARGRWSASRAALRHVLGRYQGVAPSRVELKPEPGGKPTLAESSPLRFNLSHSGGRALIAVAWEREVGVDLERIDPRRDVLALARRGLAPDEARTIEGAPAEERSCLFHAAWTRREAIAKCFGGGLPAATPDDPVSVTAVDAGPGFAAALAVAGEQLPRLDHFVIESGPVSSPAP